MKYLLLIIAVVLLLISILIYPFKVKGLLYFNLFDEIICVAVTAFKIKLLNQRLIINQEGIVSFENNKEKKQDSTLSSNYFSSLLKKIDVERVAIFFECGKSDDALYTSLACGTFNILTGSFYHFLYSKYGPVKFIAQANPNYGKDMVDLSARIVIRFSLMDMLVSVIYSYIKYFKLKGAKNGK